MSNLSIIGISLIRLLIFVKDKSLTTRIYLILNEKTSKIFIYVSFFGYLIGLDQFFVNEINENIFVLSEIDYEKFPNDNTFMNEVSHLFYYRRNFNIKYTGGTSYLFFASYMINFVVNDIMLYVIMLAIDLALLFHMKKSIDVKITNTKKLNDKASTGNKLENKKIKLTAIILLNSLILFALKISHFILSLYVFMEKLHLDENSQNICFLYSQVCTNYKEFAEFLYFVSNAYSIFLFYNLNVNFKKNIKDIVHIWK
ncbi:unnamed protein product [Brachionus calyciflorus]|uniref:Uncharacterized protein n=1 Tax=Brachionus calyciflorus TaxID=104777 RepID=A0A814Q6S0_9BILA|nr:unnamed protein product [Brachionus calyciflorus]